MVLKMLLHVTLALRTVLTLILVGLLVLCVLVQSRWMGRVRVDDISQG